MIMSRHCLRRPSLPRVGVILLLACATTIAAAAGPAKKVLIIGIDGMDPRLLDRFVQEGVMPNFERFKREGDFRPLQTSMPPLSPVAWSTFISGMDPSGHGVFDFVHRKAEDLTPYLSMSEAVPPGRSLKVGTWDLPLSGGEVHLLREGKAFWQILEEKGIPTTVFRMPANFPPSESPGRSFSGMGTPDILGTPGTFQYFSNAPPPGWKDMEGGIVTRTQIVNDVVTAKIVGPPNSFRRFPKEQQPAGSDEVQFETPNTEVEFTVYLDRDNETAKIALPDTEIVLKEGEWSDWVRVDFDMIPLLVGVNGIGRFYLQEVHPNFKLYLTPLQINPDEPAMPISTPEHWSHELADALGLFYTQELPEDTKAFSGKVFSAREFWEQAQFVYRERRRALDYFLDEFEEGLLFFYFSSLDQNSHMLWHFMDDAHPLHEADEKLRNGLKTVYELMDEALGRVLEVVNDDMTLIVMSDHGFAPFYWGVNLNTWLLEQGYVKLKNPAAQGHLPLFGNVDWTQTKAYALGLNGLYVNLKGRESSGIVEPGAEYRALLDDIETGLLALKDPRNGKNAVTLVTQTKRDFREGNAGIGPDIIVGYNWGYRTTAKSGLGEFPREMFVDNDDPWSGDHSMDYRQVPGVLLTNQRITLDEPALYDLTVAVLDEYGIDPLPEMIGRDCIAPK